MRRDVSLFSEPAPGRPLFRRQTTRWRWTAGTLLILTFLACLAAGAALDRPEALTDLAFGCTLVASAAVALALAGPLVARVLTRR